MKNRSIFSIGYSLVWAIVLLLMGCVFALFTAVSVASLLEMRQWTVVEAHLKKVSPSSTGLEISAEYEYVFAGQTYTGHQVDRDSVHSSADQQGRLKYLRQALNEKRPVPCYVDPRTPTEAVLFCGADWSGLLMTCSLSLVFAGLGIRICVFEERIDVASRFLCFWTRNTIQAEDVRRIDVAPISETESDRVQGNPFLRYSVRVF